LKAKNIEIFGGIKQRDLQAKARLDCAQREVLLQHGKAACVKREH
jgi:hypothetical protein